MEACLPTLMAGASYSNRMTLLPRSAGTVTLDISATSTSIAQQEILWSLVELGTGAS